MVNVSKLGSGKVDDTSVAQKKCGSCLCKGDRPPNYNMDTWDV
jgi:hypothetical protein